MIQIHLADLVAIARAHGLPVPNVMPAPWTGATSRVFPCGDRVIKIAIEAPAALAALTIDAHMNALARELGVQTPALVAFDDTRRIVPVPYAVFERIEAAVPLGQRSHNSRAVGGVWQDIGRKLARVHQVGYGAAIPLKLREFRQSSGVDPRQWVEELRAQGTLTAAEADWLLRLLDRLARAALADIPLALCHGDVNAANVLTDVGSWAFRALIDWAGAGWIDPVWDFAVVPLAAVP